jgi:hypothetical protein
VEWKRGAKNRVPRVVEAKVVVVCRECSSIVMGRTKSGGKAIGRNWAGRKSIVVCVGKTRSSATRKSRKSASARMRISVSL